MIDSFVYTAVTGEAPPANFTLLANIVTARLEQVLDRPLRQLERTERCRVYADGVAYPKATPIVAVSGGYDFDDVAVYTGQRGGWVEVTYTGGFPDGLATPIDLASAIAWGVHTLTHPRTDALPTGVQSLTVGGEYTIVRNPLMQQAWGADGEPMPLWAQSIADLGGRCATLAARYRRV